MARVPPESVKPKKASGQGGDLTPYHQKRDFLKTAEPRGAVLPGDEEGLRFVIQKHAARRLHCDLRLELGGVYKSWAVTRGPSLDPHEKRLAVHVEDHPVDYGDFEGIIPKGEYGGGTVMIWDRGFWRPQDEPEKGYKKGHLAFDLDVEKLHGRWHLIRTKGHPGEKKNNGCSLNPMTASPAQILQKIFWNKPRLRLQAGEPWMKSRKARPRCGRPKAALSKAGFRLRPKNPMPRRRPADGKKT